MESIGQLDFVFYGGKKALEPTTKNFLRESVNKISAHSLDYDQFLLNEPSECEGQYIVFLDQFLPHHQDFYLLKKNHKSSNQEIINQYYERLNLFFSKLEREYKTKVIIAAHPRSDYVANDIRFEGRKVMHNSSAKLVKKSKFCITFCSTAVNFAVLYHKPIVLIYMDIFSLFVRRYDQELAKAMSNELSLNFCSIDKEYEVEININNDSYSNYIDNYIKENNSEKKLFWEIVLDSLRKIKPNCK
jgi:hypothetical protein